MSHVFLFTIAIFTTLNISNAIASTTHSIGGVENQLVEEEFCTWLVNRCPALSSKYRPVENPLESVNVSIIFYSRRFLGIDDVHQAFKMQGLFYILWPLPSCAIINEEVALAENVSAMAAKTQACRFESNTMWTPFIYMTNILDEKISILNDNMDFVTISNRFGHFAWAQTAGTFALTADLDFSKFPFDSSIVHMEFMLEHAFAHFESARFEPSNNGQWPFPIFFVSETYIWEFVGNSTDVKNMDKLSVARLYFRFSRKQEYYTMTLFVPLEILMVLLVATFILPASDANRPAYSITVNLAFTVMQQTAYTAIPSTSQRVHLFWYIVYYLIIGAFVTIHTLLTLRIATNDDEKRQYFTCRVSKVDILETIGLIITIVAIIGANVDYFGNVLL